MAILKPDKENGIVLMNRSYYASSVQLRFSDSSKFKKLDTDSTLTRLHFLQSYLLRLNKRGEITDEQLDSLNLSRHILAGACFAKDSQEI